MQAAQIQLLSTIIVCAILLKIHILSNIIVHLLFTMGRTTAMEKESLRLVFGMHKIQVIHLLDPKMYVAVSNQNGFKPPCMHTS